MKKLIDHDFIDLTTIPPPMTPDEVMYSYLLFRYYTCYDYNILVVNTLAVFTSNILILILQDGVYRVFPGVASAVSTPPTPFADRQSLEAELKALEQDLDGDISKLLQAGLSNMNLGVEWNPSMVLTSSAARHSIDYSLSTDGGKNLSIKYNKCLSFIF